MPHKEHTADDLMRVLGEVADILHDAQEINASAYDEVDPDDSVGNRVHAHLVAAIIRIQEVEKGEN